MRETIPLKGEKLTCDSCGKSELFSPGQPWTGFTTILAFDNGVVGSGNVLNDAHKLSDFCYDCAQNVEALLKWNE